MKTKDIQIGSTYCATVSGRAVNVKVARLFPRYRAGHYADEKAEFECINQATGRRVQKSAAQLRQMPTMTGEETLRMLRRLPWENGRLAL